MTVERATLKGLVDALVLLAKGVDDMATYHHRDVVAALTQLRSIQTQLNGAVSGCDCGARQPDEHGLHCGEDEAERRGYFDPPTPTIVDLGALLTRKK